MAGAIERGVGMRVGREGDMEKGFKKSLPQFPQIKYPVANPNFCSLNELS